MSFNDSGTNLLKFSSPTKKIIIDEEEEKEETRNVVRLVFQPNFEYFGEIDEEYNPDGFGSLSYPNGDWYKGSFKKGKKDGIGEYFYSSDSSSYKGGWKDDMRHGDGFYICNLNDNKENSIFPNKEICYACKYENDVAVTMDVNLKYDPNYDLENDEFFSDLKDDDLLRTPAKGIRGRDYLLTSQSTAIGSSAKESSTEKRISENEEKREVSDFNCA